MLTVYGLLLLTIYCFQPSSGQPWLSNDFPISSHDLRVVNTQQSTATICRYCLCDQPTRTVTCASANLRLKTVVLPSWAETFHAHNVSVPEFPHFAYHSGLKVVRINFCALRHLHPLSFVPLPNLETIHLNDNVIEALAEGLFRRLTHLQVLSLSRNRIRNLEALEWTLPHALILERLHLDSNPIQLGVSVGSTVEWPATRQLFLSNTNIQLLNSTHMVFKASTVCSHIECRTLKLNERIWSSLTTLDLSENFELEIDGSGIQDFFQNITTLRLAKCRLSPSLLNWIDSDSNSLRHLDLSEAQLNDNNSVRQWHHCSSSLEWLDISAMSLTSLHISNRCSSLQWLYAERNVLEAVKLDSLSLRGVHLRSNHLRRWPLQTGPDADTYSHLEYLDLAQNQLDELPERSLHVLPSLQTLDLSENRLTSISRHALPTLELRLQTLNLSSNYIDNLHLPVLPSLAVLDLSANNLASLNADFWHALPILSRLRLGHNPQALLIDWNAMASSTQLTELDISHQMLGSVPPLYGLKHLRSLIMNGNHIAYLDGSLLPPCLLSLNAHDNLIHSLGNFTETQFTCLKELDLSVNPLNCDCSLAILAPILEHQPGFEDRTQYYCFADSWQHPLQSYVQSAEFCREQAEGDRFVSLFLNFLGLLAAFVIIAGVSAIAMLRVCSTLSKRMMPFSYKPVIQSEIPVDL
ncbi:hypothetical protein M3Y98_01107700 [Aphelenchoides besseyi]|nr:hypothetical protein M3Y98_01107700 [Aphelenchoides besseyi]KAI6209249.1 hypothetical protein M3Y96_00201600 [Aphelenchoides besseyi]